MNINARVAIETEETTLITLIQTPVQATQKARIWKDFCREQKKRKNILSARLLQVAATRTKSPTYNRRA